MAYPDRKKDPSEEEDVEHLGGTDSSDTGPSQGSSVQSMAAPQTAAPSAPKADKQDRYVSWDRLFNANAGNANATADSIYGKVSGEAKDSDTAIGTLLNNAQGAANNGITKEGTQSTYTGPTALSDVYGFQGAQDAWTKADTDMSVLGNRRNGNVMSLLGQNKPGGNSIMDNALVNRAGGDRFDALFQNWTGSGSKGMETAGTKFGEYTDKARQDASDRTAHDEWLAQYPGYNNGGADLGTPKNVAMDPTNTPVANPQAPRKRKKFLGFTLGYEKP